MASNGNVSSGFNINAATGDQMFPDLAFNGQNYLVCWEDRRAYPYQIYCTTVTPAVQVTSPNGIKISGKDQSDYHRMPAVASNHHDYLVVWFGARLTGDAVLASRVNINGTIIDTFPHQLSSDTLLANQITAASDGENYLVCWTSETPGAFGLGLYCRRISSELSLIDTLPLLIARDTLGIYDPSVSFGGGCYLITWQRNDNVYACRILPDGTVLDPNGFIVCADTEQQVDPAVTSDGHRFLVTWTDSRTGNYDIYGVFIDSLANVGIVENISLKSKTSFPINITPTHFTDKTNIRLNTENLNKINLDIYDIAGKLVRSYSNLSSQIVWDGKDNHQQIIPVGAYILRFNVDNYFQTHRVVKLK